MGSKYDEQSFEEAKRKREFPDSSEVKFICPKCGVISQDDVVFLCNTCDNSELIFQHGLYLCPTCNNNKESFQCMICDSREVKMEVVKGSKHHPSHSKED